MGVDGTWSGRATGAPRPGRPDVGAPPASGPAEVDLVGRHRPGGPPRRRLVGPVQVRVRDDLVGGRRPPRRLVLRRVGVTDQDRVVPPDEATVERRADAGVGLGAGDDEPPDAEAAKHNLEVGVLEGVGVVLLDQRLGVARRQLRDDPPLVAPPHQLLVGVLDPDHRDLFTARLVDQSADVGHDLVAPVGAGDDAVLHVDDEQCGLRAVLECGHGLPRSRWASSSTVDRSIHHGPPVHPTPGRWTAIRRQGAGVTRRGATLCGWDAPTTPSTAGWPSSSSPSRCSSWPPPRSATRAWSTVRPRATAVTWWSWASAPSPTAT